MSKPLTAIAGALALLLLSACGNREPAGADNSAVAAGENALDGASPAEPAQPGAPANSMGDPVPPPDAVSHPNGYLPPAPAEPEPEPTSENSSGTDRSSPTTEDQYIRNRQ